MAEESRLSSLSSLLLNTFASACVQVGILLAVNLRVGPGTIDVVTLVGLGLPSLSPLLLKTVASACDQVGICLATIFLTCASASIGILRTIF